MKKYRFLLLTFFLFVVSINEIFALTEDFQYFFDVSKNVQKIIDDDFSQITAETLFEYFVIASNANGSIAELKSWFDYNQKNIEKQLQNLSNVKFEDMSFDEKIRFCEEILLAVHQQLFTEGYLEDGSSVLNVYNGNFNCVSSSLMVSIFFLKYNIPTNVVLTKEHMFLEVQIEDKTYDVECTAKYGFDPGTKKEVLDQLGRVVGTKYVPKTNAKDRYTVSIKAGLGKVFSNQAYSIYKQGQILLPVKYNYIEYLIAKDDSSKSDFYTAFNNYLVHFFNEKQYKKVIAEVNCFNDVFNDTFFNKLRKDALKNLSLLNIDYQDFEQLNEFFLKEFEKYGENVNSYSLIYHSFIYNVTTSIIKDNFFDQALNIFVDYDKKCSTTQNYIILYNILVGAYNVYDKNFQFDYLDKKIDFLNENLSKYKNSYKDVETAHIVAKILHLVETAKFSNALDICKQYYDIYKQNADFTGAYQALYIKYGYDLYTKQEYDMCLQICEEGFKLFPYDKVLANNYSVFLQNIINSYISKADYPTAEIYVDYALKRFPTNSYFLQCKTIMQGE